MEENEKEITSNENREENRFTKLTQKVGESEKKLAEESKARADAEAAKLTAEKERDFYSSFADSAGQYPEASNFKDAIKEKVMSGYSVEDATVAVLAKEGKLNNYTPPAPKMDSPAGGSATTAMRNEGNKSLSEMTRAEKRSELERIEAEGGDLSRILRKNF